MTHSGHTRDAAAARRKGAEGLPLAGPVHRILIVKPSSFGDILHVFPALELLRRRYPGARVDFVVHPAFAPLLDYSPWRISRKILFRRQKLGSWRTMMPELIRLVRRLRRKRYDLIIDFQGLLRSALLTMAARGGPVGGFAGTRERLAGWFYRFRVPAAPGHAVERNLELADRLTGCGRTVSLPPPPENPANRLRLGRLPERYLVVAPGARWESKTFPPGLFAEVLEKVHRDEPELVFIAAGTAVDRPAAAAVGARLPEEVEFQDWTGKTSIGELMELLRHADAVLCNDSGPMHAAAFLDRPVFALFGPTDPDRTGPWHPAARVYRREVACGKCLARSCPANLECHNLDAGEIARDIVAAVRKQGEAK